MNGNMPLLFFSHWNLQNWANEPSWILEMQLNLVFNETITVFAVFTLFSGDWYST